MVHRIAADGSEKGVGSFCINWAFAQCGHLRIDTHGAYPYFAKRFWQENGIEIKMEPGDLETLKEGTVDFFTFSYYMSVCVTADSGV